MRIHYCYNPTSGDWFLGSSITDPNAVEAMIDRLQLAGYQLLSVDVMDNSWRILKAAIDNRNNITQQNHLAELAQLANNSVIKTGLAAGEIPANLAKIDATIVKGGTERLAAPAVLNQGTFVAGMPEGSVLTSTKVEESIVKGGEERGLSLDTKVAILADTAVQLETQPLSLKEAATQITKEAGKVLSVKERMALRKTEVKSK